jgi:Mrp family chromosome partitioning ATPase
MRSLLGRLKVDYRIVIIDGPPSRDSSVAEVLGPLADAVILTADRGRTRRAELRRSAQDLARARARTLGIVLVDLPPRIPALVADVLGRIIPGAGPDLSRPPEATPPDGEVLPQDGQAGQRDA